MRLVPQLICSMNPAAPAAPAPAAAPVSFW